MMAVGTVLIGRVERGQDREGSGAVAKRSVAVGRPPHLGGTAVLLPNLRPQQRNNRRLVNINSLNKQTTDFVCSGDEIFDRLNSIFVDSN